MIISLKSTGFIYIAPMKVRNLWGCSNMKQIEICRII